MNAGILVAQQGGTQQGNGIAAAKLVLRGTVVNAVTQEPVGRAVVSSPDNRFAVMTDERGRFEMRFKEKKIAPVPPGGVQPGVGGGRTVWFSSANGYGSTSGQSISSGGDTGAQPQQTTVDRPDFLSAHRPGYLSIAASMKISRVRGIFAAATGVSVAADQEEVTIPLIPESRVVGHVTLADGEGARGMGVSLYRHMVQNGRAQWLPVGQGEVKSDGEFRIAELEAGDYKLFSLELNDQDPVTSNPRGQQYGYPPDYYPGAADFGTGAVIHLAAGETFQTTLTPERRKYYPVRIGMGNGPPQRGGMVPQVEVWKDGHPGPGYSLGYDFRDGSIGGALPDGNYVVKVTSPGDKALTGITNLAVNGAPAGGSVTLLGGSFVEVQITEDFGNSEQAQQIREAENRATQQTPVSGIQRRLHRGSYITFMLWSTDEFTFRQQLMAQAPSDPETEGLEIANVAAGEYRVQVQTPIGYVASIRSGGTDLLNYNLVVGAGAAVAPIEVVLRDDGAEIDGSVVEIANRNRGAASNQAPGASAAHVYVVAEGAKTGEMKEAFVQPNGDFQFAQIAPGTYRVLAFDEPQSDLEFGNEEAMRKLEAQTFTVEPGQKKQIKVSLIGE